MAYVVKWTGANDAEPYLVNGGRNGTDSAWAPKQIWARRFGHQSEVWDHMRAAGQLPLLKDGQVKIVRLVRKAGG